MHSDSHLRFRVWPVLLWGLLLYLVMATFFGLFFTAADFLRDWATQKGGHTPQHRPSNWTLWVQLVVLALGTGAASWWHRPLRRIFRSFRGGLAPVEGERALAQKRLFQSPLVLGLGLPLVLGTVQVVLTLSWLLTTGEGLRRLPPEVRSLPVNLIFLALSGFFCYIWQKHRIQKFWLKPMFSAETLTSQLPSSRDKGIGHTLTLLAILSAVLPVGVVLTLLATGITQVGDSSSLTAEQWSLLLGNEDFGKHAAGMVAEFKMQSVPILWIDTIDTWRILIGSILGVVFMLGYVFLVYHWIAGDLTSPLYALRRAMQRVQQGETGTPEPVTSDNEIGQLTLGFNKMMKGLGERDRIKGLFGQYLTQEVSEAILDGRVKLGGDRYEVTVLFTDIRDFTALSEQLEPEEVFGFLNEYLDAMIEVLVARGGFIDKFLGDGILTVFGLPVATDDHAVAAFEAARSMKETLKDLNLHRVAEGKVPIAIGSGLHSGPVIAGNVGSSRKLQFTVIGDTVNLASRLEGLNKRYGSALTLSDSTWHRLPERLRASLPFVKEDNVEIRGKKDPVTLYRLD